MWQILVDFGTVDVSAYAWPLRICGYVLAGVFGWVSGELSPLRSLRSGISPAPLLRRASWAMGGAAFLGVLIVLRRGPEPHLLGYALALLPAYAVGVFGAMRRVRRLAAASAGLSEDAPPPQLTVLSPRTLSAVSVAALLGVLVTAAVDLIGHTATIRIYGYGAMLVLGFLFAVYWAQRRTRRAGENPEWMAACGVLALVGGVIGARAAYVMENWESFAPTGAPLWSILDVTSGGLIYYGGVALATVIVLAYIRLKRLPLRRYLDILAPCLMVGLAFGRAGCLLNGCCWGGQCRPDWPLHARFPMFSRPLIQAGAGAGPFSAGTDGPSPVYAQQLRAERIAPDERLASSTIPGAVQAPRDLHGALRGDQLAVALGPGAEARALFSRLAGEDGRLDEAEWRSGREAGDGLLRGSESWADALAHARGDFRRATLSFADVWSYLQARRRWVTARFDRDGDATLSDAERARASAWLSEDLYALASRQKSLPVKPAQLLGLINALLLAGLLAGFYRLRRREGQVFALLMVAYPVTRFILESVRADNAHSLANFVLTHNQYSSIGILAVGLLFLAALQRAPASAGPTWARRVAEAPSASGAEDSAGKNRKHAKSHQNQKRKKIT